MTLGSFMQLQALFGCEASGRIVWAKANMYCLYCRTPLSRHRHLLSVAGVSVEERDGCGATPLMHAAWGASLGCLQVTARNRRKPPGTTHMTSVTALESALIIGVVNQLQQEQGQSPRNDSRAPLHICGACPCDLYCLYCCTAITHALELPIHHTKLTWPSVPHRRC